MALTTVSSDRLATNVKNTNFTAAEKQDLTDDILPLAGQLGNRNLVINGAMKVAQRGTSSTSTGYQTVDRINPYHGGTDEAPTYAQADVASGTTPYTSGFRKCFKITNGNQTSGAGAGDQIAFRYIIEAQDIANSGWNYLSSSSFITLSFWIKSSVAQAFSGSLETKDGTSYFFKYDTPSLSADTWTKVTKTISGNSNLQFNNDNGSGLAFNLYGFIGTTYTTSNSDTETWVTGSDKFANNMTSTWYTTNDSTLEITGVQLEVGSVATDFEHRSFGQELALCQRYFEQYNFTTFDYEAIIPSHNTNTSGGTLGIFPWRVEKRATPTITLSAAGTFRLNDGGATDTQASSISISRTGKYTTKIDCNASRSQTTGLAGYISRELSSTTFIQISAEL